MVAVVALEVIGSRTTHSGGGFGLGVVDIDKMPPRICPLENVLL